MVAIEPVNMLPEAQERLKTYADEVRMYTDVPKSPAEIVERIGEADAVLLSFTSRLTDEIMEQCPNLRYVGMCCSLYSPESTNVDIRYAMSNGITVTGIRDYGDEGVIEYVVSELVRRLHGFGCEPWLGSPSEITGLKVGVVGLGKSGGMIADAMAFLGAEVKYFARSAKPWAEEKGYSFTPLGDLLEWSDVVFCCLNRLHRYLNLLGSAPQGQHHRLFPVLIDPLHQFFFFRDRFSIYSSNIIPRKYNVFCRLPAASVHSFHRAGSQHQYSLGSPVNAHHLSAHV